jgi:general secretion pathway protein D
MENNIKYCCRSVFLLIFVLFSLFHCISNAMAEDEVTLNLKDADISTLISTVSQLTGKNFVVDPRVKGKVTVVSASPLSKDEIYPIFLSILEVHGFATVPVGDIIKIIPDSQAKQGSVPTVRSSDRIKGDQVVTRILRVKNVTAAQLVPILRPLVPQQGHLAAYPSKNVLIITDRAQNVDRLARIVGKIDQVSDSKIEIVQLTHASASEIVRVISGLTAAENKANQATQITLAADERTNSVLISGEASERLRYRALISHLDTPLETDGGTRVIYLHYAKAEDLVSVLTGVSKSLKDQKTPAGAPAALASNVNIQADDASNALVITAPPDIFRSLQRVISQLDIRRAQVLVEAIIAEITLEKTRELGIQWAATDNKGALGVLNLGPNPISNLGDTLTGGDITDAAAALGTGVTGLGRITRSGISLAGLIRVLSDDTDTNILSTPSLVTLDNQEAEIVVGENVPFVTGEFSNTGGGTTPGNPFRTIERQDVGITLRVTPQINEGDAIKLDIEQEISNVIEGAADASDLTTSKRSIKTVVMVEDGRIIVLGGLIDDSLSQVNQSVPGLGDIPVLGRLFRYDRNVKKKRNLMVFLRPVILRDAATETRVTEGKYSMIRAKQLEQRRKGISLMDESEIPLLPEQLPEIPAPFQAQERVETSPQDE